MAGWEAFVTFVLGSGNVGGWTLAYLKWRHNARLKDEAAHLASKREDHRQFHSVIAELREHIDRLEARVATLEEQLVAKALELKAKADEVRDVMGLLYTERTNNLLLQVRVNELLKELGRPPEFTLVISQTGGPVG